jgi:ribosomal protein S18 acetylase RimI-like enzyme
MAIAGLEIRDATPDDADIIANCNSNLAFETEGEGLAPGIVGPGVAAVLADASKGRYWVAEADGRVVGQIMVTYEWSDWRNGMIWWIQSVYVDSEYRRGGVFSALYRHVESLARNDPDVSGVRLYVNSRNERAQRTYESLGMDMTDYRVMEAIFNEDKSC